MAIRTHVTLHCVDGMAQKTRFSYETVDENPSDGNIQNLVNAFTAISNLGVEYVTVTRPVSAVGAVPVADPDARIGDGAFLQAHKGEAFGGVYTFKFAAVRAALLNPDGSFQLTNAAFTDWCEWFDDGSGLFGLAGPFTVSDGEQLAENGSNPTLSSGGYTQIAGRVRNRRR